MNKILLLGCGHMGSALLNSWNLKTKNSFLIVDPNQYKKINKGLNKKIICFKSFNEIKISTLNKIEIVVFAIKPQIATEVIREVAKFKFKKNTVFISIVAGVKFSLFNKFIAKKEQLIRVMPNMPAQINMGMSCLVKNKNVTLKNKKLVDHLFSTVGETLWLKKESDINKVTAISGSGPGYIFFIIDAYEKAAFEMGLGEEDTKKLVHQTLFGSINLLLKNNLSALKLSDLIAVKGGTTQAGLDQFKNKKILHKVFKRVIKAAYNRANLLGK